MIHLGITDRDYIPNYIPIYLFEPQLKCLAVIFYKIFNVEQVKRSKSNLIADISVETSLQVIQYQYSTIKR